MNADVELKLKEAVRLTIDEATAAGIQLLRAEVIAAEQLTTKSLGLVVQQRREQLLNRVGRGLDDNATTDTVIRKDRLLAQESP